MSEVKINNIDRFRKEKDSEHVCEVCGDYMVKIKKPSKNRWSKKNSIFRCSCGHQFRERTNNEILRDMGERD